MPPDLKAYTHDNIPAQETWVDCAIADGGRLRLVLLAADPQAAMPLLARARSIAQALTDGGYVLHLAARDATWFMDGYWPSVQFAVDDVPIAWVCES